MRSVSERAPAKLNLFLRVVGRRSDGYHLIDSLAAFVAVGDLLTATPADDLSLALDGPFARNLPAGLEAGASDNLVLRAARALQESAGVRIGAEISLTKRLPVASGIGGGSADAAATLRALNDLWSLNMSAEDLAAIGLSLGADIPVCLGSRAALMAGIGDVVLPVAALPAAGIVLANPGVPVPTAAVFAARTGVFSSESGLDADMLSGACDAHELANLLRPLGNDLTSPAIAFEPGIERVLSALTQSAQCLLARLSGSGATCFGLFADTVTADRAAASLTRGHPDWWVVSTTFESGLPSAVECPPATA